MIETTTVQVHPVNRYSYNTSNLWAAYGVAIVFALAAVATGMLAFRSNGASHDDKFSTILSISRDPELSNLFPSCCHGKLPLPKATMNAKLSVEQMADGGQSLRWRGVHKPVCSICKQDAEASSGQRQRRRSSSVWNIKWPRARTSEVSG